MFKKASRRTGGSSLTGWSTRRQSEPRTGPIVGPRTRDWDRIQPRGKKRLLPAPPKTTPALLKQGSAELQKAKGGVKAAMAKAAAAIRKTRKRKLAAALEEKTARMLVRHLAKDCKTKTPKAADRSTSR
jgi:hypothetical protein